MASLLLILLCIVPSATATKGDGVREANDFIRARCREVVECQPATFTGANPVMPCEDWESYNICFRQTAENCGLDDSAEFSTAMGKKRENCMSQCETTLSFEQCDGYISRTTSATTTTTTTAAAAIPAATATLTQSATATAPTGQKGENATEGVGDDVVDDDDNFNWMDLLGNSGMCLSGGYVVAVVIVAANWI